MGNVADLINGLAVRSEVLVLWYPRQGGEPATFRSGGDVSMIRRDLRTHKKPKIHLIHYCSVNFTGAEAD